MYNNAPKGWVPTNNNEDTTGIYWDKNKSWEAPDEEFKQEGGLIRQYAIGDYVEEGKEVFDAGVDATKTGISAVGQGASAVADRYGRNDYADAKAGGAGDLLAGTYATGEALQQAGSDTLTAGAAGLGAISKLAKGTKNMAVAGYGGAKDWLGAGGWNQNAAVAGEDTLDDDGNVIEKGRSAAERVWSGEARGSLKQRMSKGAGLLGGLLQDASVAQGFEGAPEGYYDKFGFSKTNNAPLEQIGVPTNDNQEETPPSLKDGVHGPYEVTSGNIFEEDTGPVNNEEEPKRISGREYPEFEEEEGDYQVGGFISMDGFIRQSWRNL